MYVLFLSLDCLISLTYSYDFLFVILILLNLLLQWYIHLKMNATRKLKNDHIMIRRVKDMIKHTPKLYTINIAIEDILFMLCFDNYR